ncbi:MAG: PorP/SprF family type IX secretion system membrane protein, partial [Bacteroidota bacterium]
MYFLIKLFLFVFAFTVFHEGLYGQYQNFSQFNFTPDRINPGRYIEKDEAALRVAYRNLGTNTNLNMNTMYASGSYPLSITRSETGWGAVNFSVFNDATNQSGLFKATELALGYTHILQTSRDQFLGFGMLVRYTDKGINLRNYSTGSQFNPVSGFDPSIDIGENFGDFQSRYYSVGAGVFIKGKDLIDKEYFLGLSLYDVNRPNESVLAGESAIPLTLQAEGGYHFFENDDYGIIPSFLYTRSGGTDLLNIGSAFQYRVNQLNTIELHTRYKIAKAVVLGLQYHTPQFSTGFSYDIQTGLRNNVFNNAFEVGMEFRKGITPKERQRKIKNKKEKKRRKKKKKIKKDKETPDKKQIIKNKKTPSIQKNPKIDKENNDLNTVKELKNKMDSLQTSNPTDSTNEDEITVKVGEIQREKTELGQKTETVYFDFNKITLNSASEKALDSWVSELKNKSFLKLIIV